MAGFTFKVTRNDISPALSKLVASARNKEPVLRAMGSTFKSITEGNFSSVGRSYRPTPWAPKAGGGQSILQSQNPTLSKSFQLTVTSESATLSNPMKYAAIHQFGGTIKAKGKALRFKIGDRWVTVKQVYIPPRPFFPVDASGKLTSAAEDKIRRAGERAIARQVPGMDVK